MILVTGSEIVAEEGVMQEVESELRKQNGIAICKWWRRSLQVGRILSRVKHKATNTWFASSEQTGLRKGQRYIKHIDNKSAYVALR